MRPTSPPRARCAKRSRHWHSISTRWWNSKNRKTDPSRPYGGLRCAHRSFRFRLPERLSYNAPPARVGWREHGACVERCPFPPLQLMDTGVKSTKVTTMPLHSGPVSERATLADRLLHATTPEQVADVMLEGTAALSASGTCVMWSGNWPHSIDAYPSPCLEPDALAAANAALLAVRAGGEPPAKTHVLCDQDGATAILYVPSGLDVLAEEELRSAGARMAEALAIQRLHDTVAQLAQTEQLQRALFAIADMAGSGLDMPDMLRGLHRIVGELMYAENFFIALSNEVDDNIRFLYFVDSVDDNGPNAGDEFPLDRIKHGPTWWTIHERKPWMGTTEQLQAQIPGPLNIHGADSHDWLSVPMLRDGHVRGVLVVQSYKADMTFGSTDMALLGFVGEHILTALERKQGQEELERRVVERTAQLAETNEELRQEVAERQRGERLQSALYQIAALAR